jgi:Fic family protein
MPRYIHQLKGWPSFQWSHEGIVSSLAHVRHKQGKLDGRMESLGFNLRNEATLDTLTLDVLKSSEIEGERLDAKQVRSSIAKRLGIDIEGLVPADRHVEGIVEMMLDAIQNFQAPLTADRLFSWHAAMFPTGRSGMQKVKVGAWRDNTIEDPMQVVSGAMGRERVHFEAPAAELLAKEISGMVQHQNGY